MRVDIVSFAADPNNPKLLGSVHLLDKEVIIEDSLESFLDDFNVVGEDNKGNLKLLTPKDGQAYLEGIVGSMAHSSLVRAALIPDEPDDGLT